MEMSDKVSVGCFGLVVIINLFLLITGFTGLHVNTGEGQHTGYVTAVQKQGIFFKTWRAYIKTDTQSSQEDMYCIVDEKVVEKLKEAAEKKEQVTVTYFSWFSAGVSNCSSENDVIGGIK